MRRAIYPGSFDPVTNGHLDIIRRAASLADELIVAVVANPSKKCLFTLEERREMLAGCLEDLPNIKIVSFAGLLADFARQLDAQILVKGLRSAADFEYEAPMAHLNKSLNSGLETVFLLSSPALSFVSSSAVREIAALGGDISRMVPVSIAARLKDKFSL
ncbi:MAG: pantetheine-phosphate adenylyltransferase [bacterium]|nr:pantetheine-phosphate adenylyltransferase [bacterium]